MKAVATGVQQVRNSASENPHATEEVFNLLRFRKDIAAVFSGLPGSAGKGRIVLRRALWVNPETHRRQHTEWQRTVSEGGRVDSVLEHFEYDQPAPAGVFDDAPAPNAQGAGSPAAMRTP